MKILKRSKFMVKVLLESLADDMNDVKEFVFKKYILPNIIKYTKNLVLKEDGLTTKNLEKQKNIQKRVSFRRA